MRESIVIRSFCSLVLISAFLITAWEYPLLAQDGPSSGGNDRIDKEFFRAVRNQNVPGVKVALSKYESELLKVKNKEDSVSEALILGRMGEAEALLGRFPESLGRLETAMSIFRQYGQSGMAARLQTIAALVNYITEQPDVALAKLEETAVSQESDPDITRKVNIFTALGGVYNTKKNKERSLESYEKARLLSRSVRNRSAEAFAIESIRIYHMPRSLEHQRQAIELFREAEKTPPEIDETLTCRILTSLGNALHANTREELARFMAFDSEEERLAFIRKPRSLGVVPLSGDIGELGRGPYALAKLGVTHFANKEKSKALDAYLEALEWSRSIGSWSSEEAILGYLAGFYAAPKIEERFQYYFTLMQLSMMHKGARHQLEGGRGVRNGLEFGLIWAERARRKIVTEELRASFSIDLRRYYERFITTLMQMHSLEPLQGHNSLAFRVAELSRSRMLLDSLKSAKVDLLAGVGDDLLEKQRAAQAKLNALADKQVRLLSLPAQPEKELNELNEQLGIAAREYTEIHGLIKRRRLGKADVAKPSAERIRDFQKDFISPLTADNPVDPLPFTMTDLQRELSDDDTVLLEYFLGDNESYVWAVTGTELHSFAIPGKNKIEEAARKVISSVSETDRWSSGSGAKEEYSEAAQDLSEMILGPVAERIRGKRIVLVTDGILQYVPFSALPWPNARPRRIDLNEMPLLAVTTEVISLPSAAVLTVLRTEMTATRRPGNGMAIIADPVFSQDDDRVRKSPGKPTTSPSNNPKTGNSTAPDQNRSTLEKAFRFASRSGPPYSIPRLPFTRREAESIFTSAPKTSSFKALDFDASKEAILARDLSKYKIIHFATHGILHSEHPELSGIVLSLVNQKGRPVNGFLRLNEIYNMNLNADLVVLSACQTALGKEVRGEGLVGLTRGFMYAGSPRVVASLWKVDDVATAEFMKIFYQKMLKEKLRPAAALREAKIEMMKQKRWRSPYYWAAFELQGDWR